MKRRILCAAGAFILASLALAGGARAQALEKRRSLIGTGRFWGSIQAELVSVDDPFQDYFFNGGAQQFTAEAGVRLFDNFDLLGSLGYRYESAHQVSEADLVTRLTNKDTLHTIPMTASLRYRLQWDPDAWLVPYVRGGMTGAWFIYDEDTVGAKKIWGMKWGVHAGGGALWRIDGLDKNSRRSLQNQGIDAMYLETGFYWQRINNFGTHGKSFYGGEGLDYSGMGARLGISIWVR